MFNKKKKTNNFELLKNEINEVKVKNELLNTELKGYYNQERLLVSEGLLFRDKDLFKIDIILFDYFKRLMRGLFTYEDLPNDIPEEFLETNLFDRDLAFYQVGNKYYISKFNTLGTIDAYGRDIRVQPIIESGTQMGTFKIGEDVVILKGTETLPMRLIIDPFIKRLNLNNEASNRILRLSMVRKLFTSESKVSINTLKKAMQQQMDKGGGIIFSQIDDSAINKITDYDLFSEFDNASYWTDFQNIFNFVLTLMGIPTNDNEDKKERLVVDEVNMGNLKSNIVLNELIRIREKKVKEINDMFGLNIKVKSLLKPEEIEDKKEMNENETNEDIRE